jgi:hypothetical protein
MQCFMRGNWQLRLRPVSPQTEIAIGLNVMERQERGEASTALYMYEPGSWGPAEAAHVAPPKGWWDPKPASSSGVAFSSRESTALGQFAQRSPRNEFHQKIDEGADLER